MPPGKNQIDQILKSLDGISKLKAPDFFYTRLQARMEKELKGPASPPLLLRPAFLNACLAMILVANLITLATGNKNSEQVKKQQAPIEGFANEYNMSTSEQLYE